MRTPGPLLVVIAMTIVACHHGADTPPDLFPNSPDASTPSFPTDVTSTSTASPTQPALPPEPPATSGLAGATCVQGWVTPSAGTPRRANPLQLIRQIADHSGQLKVVDMRYFLGPESPPSDQGYIKEIERWYVRVYDPEDLSFQGRFIVEQNRFGRGVVAVAPYDTKGYKAPDWSGFQWDAGDVTRRTYPRLPGTWEGIRYDFVDGGAGLTIPGLPEEVVGCLAGT
jgi:hypothetical protein